MFTFLSKPAVAIDADMSSYADSDVDVDIDFDLDFKVHVAIFCADFYSILILVIINIYQLNHLQVILLEAAENFLAVLPVDIYIQPKIAS